MEKMILAVNTGSASKKYALYSGEKELLKLHLELEDHKYIANIRIGATEEKIDVSETDYKDSVNFLLKLLSEKEIMKDIGEIGSIGVRIVAPGEYFYLHNPIDETYFRKLEEAKQDAPLHIAPIVLELENLKKVFPIQKIYGISDGAFHRDLPEVSKFYALPQEASQNFGIYKNGYHGISVKSVLRKVKNLLGSIPERIIVCHLGSGSSITAVKSGKSFDTSMGYTPLEGLPMGTRIGDIDPGALIYLGEKTGMGYKALEEYLNKSCGLLGLSGKSSDIRELLELEKNGDERAKLALGIFVYRIKKYIGAYVAAMGGLDLLVFTATIGERSIIIRGRICEGLQSLGISLNISKNKYTESKDMVIGARGKTKIAVVATDELGEIARETAEMSV